jgi:hypothetical protein
VSTQQYVTLVGLRFRVLGKSHIVYPSFFALSVWTQCGKIFSVQDERVKVTNDPECLGVFKTCQRRAL